MPASVSSRSNASVRRQRDGLMPARREEEAHVRRAQRRAPPSARATAGRGPPARPRVACASEPSLGARKYPLHDSSVPNSPGWRRPMSMLPYAARREAGERAFGGRRRERQVPVGPRHDVLHDVGLPRARPFAVELRGRAGRRHHGDEWRHLSRADQPVGDGGEPEAADEAVRRATQAVQQIQRGVARGAPDAGRQVDERRARVTRIGGIRDHPLPHGAAGRAGGDARPAGRCDGRRRCGRPGRRPAPRTRTRARRAAGRARAAGWPA